MTNLPPIDALVHAFGYLDDSRDVCAAASTNQAWNEAAASPVLWRRLAEAKYGPSVAASTIDLYQGDWRALMFDQNLRGARPSRTIQKRSYWRYGYHSWPLSHFYCCIVDSIELDRLQQQVRVHIDARGETDLTHPLTTVISYTVGDKTERLSPLGWEPFEPDRVGRYIGCLTFDWTKLRAATNLAFLYASAYTTPYGSTLLYDYAPVVLGTDGLALDAYVCRASPFIAQRADWSLLLPARPRLAAGGTRDSWIGGALVGGVLAEEEETS